LAIYLTSGFPLTMQQAVLPGRDLLTWHAGSISKIMFLQVVGRPEAGRSLDQVKASINVTFSASASAPKPERSPIPRAEGFAKPENHRARCGKWSFVVAR